MYVAEYTIVWTPEATRAVDLDFQHALAQPSINL
jgi:hypothetical protein